MNNIPQDTLQAVADAAFRATNETHLVTWPDNNGFWPVQEASRRAVIQHALDNPALAPFLAGGIGEYTDEEIGEAWDRSEGSQTYLEGLRAFLTALPRRENTALAEAIARAEKAEAERDFERSTADEAIARSDRTYAQICRAARSVGWVNMVESGPITTFIRKIGDELSTLKSAQLGIIRPIAEMPETVPDGFIAVTGGKDSDGDWTLGDYADRLDTHFAILRLPAAEARQERPVGFNSALETWGAAEPTPPAEPAAQVPLGPEDCPPGSALRSAEGHWFSVIYISPTGVTISNPSGSRHIRWHDLQDKGWQINTSLAFGRWNKDAWRDCSKPAGKEVAK